MTFPGHLDFLKSFNSRKEEFCDLHYRNLDEIPNFNIPKLLLYNSSIYLSVSEQRETF